MRITRIDQVPRALAEVRSDCTEIEHEVQTLHDLAYSRSVAVEAQVSGGSPDYALDTHGDPQARSALKRAMSSIEGLADRSAQIRDSVAYAVSLHHSRHASGRRDSSADATRSEVAVALAAKTRRGERVHPEQVGISASRLASVEGELTALQGAVRKAGRHPEPGRLSTAERDAWRRAAGTDRRRRRKVPAR